MEIKTILPIVLLLLTACATNDTAERQSWEDGQVFGADNLTPITLTATDAALAETAATRAETEIQTALFDADEVLQAYVWHVGDEANNSFEPLLTTREATGGVNPLVANQRIYWPADITKTVSLYALYPSVVTKTTTDFTVSADQRDDDSYKASDLMYGARTNVPYSDDPLNIPFAHKMAKLVVNATSDGSVSGVDVTGITVKSVKRKIGFNAVTGALGGDATLGDEGNIVMSNNGACLLPPQTIAADHGLIEVAVSIGGTAATATFKAASAMPLQEGYQYTLNLKIGSQSLAQTANITDWSSVSPYHTIAPVELGSISMDAIDAVTYNGLEQTPDVTVRDAASKTALTLDTDYTLDYYANTNAGTALVVATGKSGTDYVGQVAVQKFIIEKAAPIITAPTAKNLTYNGTKTVAATNQTLANAGSTTGGQMVYSSSASGPWSDVIPAEKNAGSYAVYYKVVGGVNYKDTEVESISTSIAKKTIADWSISPGTLALKTEGGNPHTGTITINYGDVDNTADHGTVSWSSSDSGKASVSGGTVTGESAGSATITVGIADGNNYIFSGSKACSVTITVDDPGVPLQSTQSQVGYIFASNGKAYNPDDWDNRPSGVTVKGMVAYKNGSNGIVMAKDDISPVKRETAIAYNISDGTYLKANGTTGNVVWKLGAQADYGNAINVDLTTINNRLTNAQCSKIMVNGAAGAYFNIVGSSWTGADSNYYYWCSDMQPSASLGTSWTHNGSYLDFNSIGELGSSTLAVRLIFNF